MGRAKAEKKDSKKSETVAQEVDYKALYTKTLGELADAEQTCEALGAAIEALSEAMGETMGELSEMKKLVDKNLTAIEHHCKMTKDYTGELLGADVTYAVNMARRVLDYELNQESED